MRIKHIHVILSTEDQLIIKIKIEKNKVLEFSVNYIAKIDGKWEQIYRVDTAHGYLHEQRFWISSKPFALKRLERVYDKKTLLNMFIDKIKNNYLRFKKYYEDKR